MKEYGDNYQKLVNLKNKIEEEMTKVDKLYDNVYKEVTEAYKLKLEQIMIEENNLKEKLQIEVTKVKEQLEKFLSETNKNIKIRERINKGIKSFENEEKNMIKKLSYISTIKKSQKEMKTLYQHLMKNLKITFNQEKSDIIYEDYYFNGIQPPKNIEFKNISSNSFELFWKIDDINILNIDKQKIKYRVEIRKENLKEKFIQIYEGINQNCLIDNLIKNTNYEIKICSIYNDITSNWTEIKKVKTKNLDSIILKESQREDELFQKIMEWSGYKNMELLYRGSRDGTTAVDFHKKCDKQGPTICLYKNEKGNIFGGYASVSWESDKNGAYCSAPDCFLFTLINIYNTGPTKFSNSNTNYSIENYFDYGPIFGGGYDIYVPSNYKNKCQSNFPHSYQDTLGKGKSLFTGDFNNNNSYFIIKEIEVFKLFK